MGGRRMVGQWAVAAAIGVASCTPMHWEKPGIAPDLAEADNLDCYHRADAQAFRFGGGWWYDPWPGAYFPFRRYPFHDPFWEHDWAFVRQDLHRFCMESKGYRLVPD